MTTILIITDPNSVQYARTRCFGHLANTGTDVCAPIGDKQEFAINIIWTTEQAEQVKVTKNTFLFIYQPNSRRLSAATFSLISVVADKLNEVKDLKSDIQFYN